MLCERSRYEISRYGCTAKSKVQMGPSAPTDLTDGRACSLAHRRDLRRHGAMSLQFRRCLPVAIVAQAVSFSGIFGNLVIFLRSLPTVDPPLSIQTFSSLVSRVFFAIVASSHPGSEKDPRQRKLIDFRGMLRKRSRYAISRYGCTVKWKASMGLSASYALTKRAQRL